MSEDAPATAVTRVDTPRVRARTARPDTVQAARLGHFQLLDVLGTGGMGTVYAAYDLNLDRKVAIKVLQDDGDEPETPEQQQQRNQRFLREAQAMAKLSHPNVVPIYEVGADGGTVFLAMEYVAGEPLDVWLRKKPSWRTIVDVFVQAGRGLAAAHAAGIVHRDFKPANVLIDERASARVTDFGIALIQVQGDQPTTGPVEKVRLSESDLTPPTTDTPLTRHGALVGTPAYMSPEQFEGNVVDARSDQFSFCIALFEALFGKRPFAGSRLDLKENVLAGNIEKPDARTQVPGWVTSVIHRGLSTDPAQRFASMTDLVEVLARDPGRRRRRIALGTLGGATIAAAAALVAWQLSSRNDAAACTGSEQHLVGVWDPTVKAGIERSFAATNLPYAAASAKRVISVLDGYAGTWVAMHGDACRATRVQGEQSEHVLDLRMACLASRRDELRSLTAVLSSHIDPKTAEKAVDAASSLTPVSGCADIAMLVAPGSEPANPEAAAERRKLEGRLDQLLTQRRLGRNNDTLPATKTLVGDIKKQGDLTLLARALALQGEIETRMGKLEDAEATLAVALRHARKAGDPDVFVGAAIDYFDALADAGISKSREALGVARIAKAMMEDTHDPTLAVRMLVSEGDSMLTLARRKEALPILQEAAELCKRTLGEDHHMMLRVQAVLAPVLGFNEKHDEAEAVFDAAIARATATLGAQHPMTISIRLDQCHDLATQKGPAVAPACYEPALHDADTVMGAGDRDLAIARMYYATALRALNKQDDARKVLASAYRNIPDEAWSEKWYVAVDVARTLGNLELAAHDYKNAFEHCSRAGEITEQEHREFDVDACVGDALLGLGENDKALATLEAMEPRAASMELSLRGPWRFSLARAVWAVKHDASRARALAKQAVADVAGLRPEVDAWLASVR